MSDLYSKIVLTIIAASLGVIAFRGQPTTEAHAQSGPLHVIVDSVSSYAFQYAGPMAVHVQ